MKEFLLRLLQTVFGLFLYALGIVLSLKANIGYAPWEVFHVGIADTVGVTIGTVSISVGLLIVIVVVALGEKIGLGTILNMILIGLFVDLLLALNLIPTAGSLPLGLVLITLGLFSIAVGAYFYIKAGFGAGPRDGLMVAFTRKTGIPVGICRTVIEFTVALIGWFLGGMVGIGTIISVVFGGPCFQLVFKLFRFDATEIQHETLAQTFAALKAKNEPDPPPENDPPSQP